VYLPLTERERSALRRYAESEDRDPRIQAARFVREGLERVGILERAAPTRETDDGPSGEGGR
jgi:hypothetical protein